MEYRILVVDDNPAIHEDFHKTLVVPRGGRGEALDRAASVLFDEPVLERTGPSFDLEFAFQGEEAVVKVGDAVSRQVPFAMAFVDVHMPPGWDGIETIRRMWLSDPELQIVICTAYSDYSWNEIVQRLGNSDRFLILKKPFDTIEVRQLAFALTSKWQLAREVSQRLANLETLVEESTFTLRETNRQLEHEVADHREARAALRDMSRRNELLLTSAGQGIFGQDIHGLCTFINPAGAKLLGYTAEELIGQRLHPLIHRDHGDAGEDAARCPMLRNPDGGQASQSDTDVLWRRDGTTIPVEYITRPIVEKGKTVGLVVTFNDITERLAMERHLRESQKLEAVGRLAAGIAHDFNNLLTVVMCNAFMVADLELGGEIGARIDDITEAAERAAGLTRQLLLFSKQRSMEPTRLDLNRVVADVGRMLCRLLGEDISVEIDSTSEILPIMADRGMLEQVIVNLAVNARDAMPGGGHLTLRTGRTVPPLEARQPGSAPGPDWCAYLSVTDTGTGMSSDTIERIFEPFFTTKAQGKGTGIGLATVHGIVRQHQGSITVQSQPGCGSTFAVYWPLDRSEVAEIAMAVRLEARPRGGNETILVVEDEVLLRGLARTTLERIGYHVVEASSGPQTGPVWEQHRGNIDLLVTDLIMPGGMNGCQLAQQLRADKPELKVVYCSGYSADVAAGLASLQPGVNFLPKPYNPDALARIVRGVLDTPASNPSETAA